MPFDYDSLVAQGASPESQVKYLLQLVALNNAKIASLRMEMHATRLQFDRDFEEELKSRRDSIATYLAAIKKRDEDIEALRAHIREEREARTVVKKGWWR